MDDENSQIKEANWPGNTEVLINPMTVSVSYKQIKHIKCNKNVIII